jgi:TnsA endonuclease N terminal
MANFRQGNYLIKNPAKYVGKGTPRYRSGWEMTFMMFLDSNDNVLQWASESISIPYRNPLTGKQSVYIPDFLVTYKGRGNTTVAELIEIKPKKQSLIESKASDRDRAIVALNYAKWDAATKWAKRNGLTFRVINEDMIYHQGGTKRGK